jgi:hypothetical protein
MLSEEERNQHDAIEQQIAADPIGAAVDTMAELTENPWCAVIKYIDGSWSIFGFEEFDEFGQQIENLRHWGAIADITIKRILRAPIGDNAAPAELG